MEFLNIQNNEVVHQRCLLIDATVVVPDIRSVQVGVVGGAPNVAWPVTEGVLKCLVILEPGPNSVSFTDSNSDTLLAQIQIQYVPLLQAPPLHLAIMVASDSSLTFDAPPDKVSARQNTLEQAIEKFRCTAYMWQAFTAEQLRRKGHQRRSFRLEEGWMEDTVFLNERKLRNTAKVHIVRSKKTMAQLRAPKAAQQYKGKGDGNSNETVDLYGEFMDALRSYGAPFDKQCYVAGLILDTKWDSSAKLITAHAALGGGAGHIRLGMFGSHCLHAYPSNLHSIHSALMDATPTDSRYLGNDCNEAGTHWKAFNIGAGAHLHEVGHLFTLTHTNTGIMSRGFNNFNRSFLSCEPGSRKGIRVEDEDGSHFNRCDCVRLRYHPAFMLPQESLPSEKCPGPSVYPFDNTVLITVETSANLSDRAIPSIYPTQMGIALIEFYVGDRIRHYLEFGSNPQSSIEKRVSIEFNDALLFQLGVSRSELKNVHLEIVCTNSTNTRIENMEKLLRESRLDAGQGRVAYKTKPCGLGLRNPHTEFTAWLTRPTDSAKLKSIRVSAANYVYGMVFAYDRGDAVSAGNPNVGQRHEFVLRDDETIVEIRASFGWWLDGIEILTSSGRSSGWMGGRGGDFGVLKVPSLPNAKLLGFSGTAGDLVDSLAMLYGV